MSEDLKILERKLDEAQEYEERSKIRKQIRDLKKLLGQSFGSAKHGGSTYKRPGTGLAGPTTLGSPIITSKRDGIQASPTNYTCPVNMKTKDLAEPKKYVTTVSARRTSSEYSANTQSDSNKFDGKGELPEISTEKRTNGVHVEAEKSPQCEEERTDQTAEASPQKHNDEQDMVEDSIAIDVGGDGSGKEGENEVYSEVYFSQEQNIGAAARKVESQSFDYLYVAETKAVGTKDDDVSTTKQEIFVSEPFLSKPKEPVEGVSQKSDANNEEGVPVKALKTTLEPGFDSGNIDFRSKLRSSLRKKEENSKKGPEQKDFRDVLKKKETPLSKSTEQASLDVKRELLPSSKAKVELNEEFANEGIKQPQTNKDFEDDSYEARRLTRKKTREARNQCIKGKVQLDLETKQKSVAERECKRQPSEEELLIKIDKDRRAVKERDKKAAEERERKAAEESKRKAAEERERKAAEERERKTADERQKMTAEERERKVAEEREKKAAEERERKAANERERKASEERERKAAEERERKAAEERERKDTEKRERKATEEREMKAVKERERKTAEERERKATKERERKAAEERERNAGKESVDKPKTDVSSGIEETDSVALDEDSYEARRLSRKRAREAKKKEGNSKSDDNKLTYMEKRELEKKQATANQASQPSQPKPKQPPTKRQTSNPTKQMLDWAKHKTRYYDHVNIVDFTTSWKNGIGLAAIMHAYMPESVSFNELSPDDPKGNFDAAFAAMNEAGIPIMMDAEDFVNPDAKSVMTFLVTIYQYFN